MPLAETIFVTFRKKDDRFTGHSIAFERPSPETFKNWSKAVDETPATDGDENKATELESHSFKNVISSFLSMMATYRNVISSTIELSPLISTAIANQEIGTFVANNGLKIPEFENENFSVYEISQGYFSTLVQKHEASMAAIKGAEHLPEISVIGLISVYDAYLAKLLKVVFKTHEEMILTSDREIKYSDLLKYGSLDDAKNQIIEKDVESVIRNSHHEQFSWMEKKFSLPLRKDLKVWPDFIELCERRNLLTHTGGLISEQYRTNCMAHGKNIQLEIGHRLVTDATYFKDAVQIVSEVGLKLGHVLWRKFVDREREAADSALNQTGLDLIIAREYFLAEKLLELGAYTFKSHGSDSTRRMMIINMANAVRLQGNGQRAKQILDKEDWSATGLNFQVCIAAVRDNIETVCKLMRQGGKDGPLQAEDYRDWPVFRGMRHLPEFRDAYREVYGQEILSQENLTMPQTPTNVATKKLVSQKKLKVIENSQHSSTHTANGVSNKTASS
ncbi:hypothetical protein V9K92_15345 [Phyllobacterium sp. CCNWLW109]|uniref:hypothetical protein n=1 Tax=Phyllobacterium sp. CCNWLW109 TaxID=3127479 RepID=UPI0030784000